jgi:subtilisin family serine protease
MEKDSLGCYIMVKEYNVTLKEGIDYSAFWEEIEREGCINATVPERPVSVYNDRKGFKRICSYLLGDDEVEELRKDPRVEAVELPMHLNSSVLVNSCDVDIMINAPRVPTKMFRYSWGKYRVGFKHNPYIPFPFDPTRGSSTRTSPEVDIKNYTSTRTGSGVDIVIFDSGIEPNHPEFGGRVVQLDWTQYMNTSQPVYGYTEGTGHGTQVASIAAGEKFGIANGANIYAIPNISFNTAGYSSEDCFDAILNWHKSKPVNPVTGKPYRPTVVSITWMSSGIFDSRPTTLVYKGVTFDITNINNDQVFSEFGYRGIYNYKYNYTDTASNAAVDELIDAGIHVVISAGNDYYKLDAPGGVDYDNTVDDEYYHRKASPTSNRAIIVGSIDSIFNYNGAARSSQEFAEYYSNRGPGISIFAPGTNVPMAKAIESIYTSNVFNYPGYEGYEGRISSGTSYAAPLVAGCLALHLEGTPTMSPKVAKKLIEEGAGADILHHNYYNTDQGNYNTFYNLFGGTSRVVYNPFTSIDTFKITNSY